MNTDQTYEEWKEGMKDKSVGEYRLNMQGRKEELKACARKWKWIKYAEKHNLMLGKSSLRTFCRMLIYFMGNKYDKENYEI